MTRIPIIEVRNAMIPHELGTVGRLWFDYLTWVNNEMQSRHGVHPHEPGESVEEDIASISKYRSFGFRDIEPYAESEIPEQFRPFLVFMERDL